MQTLRAIFSAGLLSIFCGFANAQSSAMSFFSLPIEAQASISAALMWQVSPPWPQLAKLTPSDGVFGESFGVSVAVSGNTIVVGTSIYSSSNEAYVFVKPASGWEKMKETA